MKKSPLTKLQQLYPNYDYGLVDITNIDQLKLKTLLVVQHYSVSKLENQDKQLFIAFDRFNQKQLYQLLQSLNCKIIYFGNEDLNSIEYVKGYSIVPGFYNYDCNRMKYSVNANWCMEHMKDFFLYE